MSDYQFDYIIYHLVKPKCNCPDGIASAWVCHKYNPNAQIIGMCYGDELPDLPVGCNLICVDFSFTKEQLQQLENKQIRIIIIDHHVSAFNMFSEHTPVNLSDGLICSRDSLKYWYDVNECGASLTWRVLFPNQVMPSFLKYVKDRDLWEHKLPKTKEMFEALSILGRTFETFDYLAELSEEKLLKLVAPIGQSILEKKQRTISKLCHQINLITEKIGGYEVIGIQLKPYYSRWTSDIAEHLYKLYPDMPFVFCKGISKEDGTKYSLRSSEQSGFDVSKIAESYGGGGHKHAAGFVMTNVLE